MVISSTTVASGTTTNDATIAMKFTSSESTTDLIAGDITVTNGSIGALSGSGEVYTATLTPDASGAVTVKISAGAYSDAAGNTNTVSNTFSWTYDGTLPTITGTVSYTHLTLPTKA